MEQEKATEKQIQALMKAKLHDTPWTLTKKEAWTIMNEKFGNNGDDVDLTPNRPGEAPKVAQKGSNGQTAMYVSYAKDLIVAGKTMEEAINTIQVIKEAF